MFLAVFLPVLTVSPRVSSQRELLRGMLGAAALGFAHTLASDPRLAAATACAFQSLHEPELRMVRQAALDQLLEWTVRDANNTDMPRTVAKRQRQ